MQEIKAGCEGILVEKLVANQRYVKRGGLMAEIIDYESNVLRQIVAKNDAFIASMPLKHFVTPNDIIYTLAEI